MPLQMVDADHGDTPTESKGLRGRNPDQERPHKPGSACHRHTGEIGSVVDTRLRQGSLHDGGDGLGMGPAGQLGHDSTKGRVQIDLARHHRRADFEVLVDHGCRRLVA